MTKTDVIPGNGMRTKVFSILVVSLFIASAFCAMIAVPVESETVTKDESIITDGTDDPVFSDNPGPDPVNIAADFVNKPVAALEALNTFLAEGSEPCTWDANKKILTLTQIDFHTDCTKDEDIGAGIYLPADSTVELKYGCRIVVDVSKTNLTRFYGLHCLGDLHFITNDYTIEFVLTDLRGGELAVKEFSAGLRVDGKLDISGNQTGRLAIRSGINACSPMIGIYAKDGFSVKNSEMLVTATVGTCLGGKWQFGDYCTIGLYSPTVTFDCMDCQKIVIKGGLIKEHESNAKSCGIVTEKMEVKHGKVTALGGNHFEVDTSIGVEFLGNEPMLTGYGTLSASGGNAGDKSIGIFSEYTSNFTIRIREMHLSGSFCGTEIFGMDAGNVIIKDSDVNVSITLATETHAACGMKCRTIDANGCDFDVQVDGCTHSWCMLISIAKFTGCTIRVEVMNNQYNPVTGAYGIVCEQLDLKDCDVYAKSSDSRFTTTGISVASPGSVGGNGWITIDHSKVHVETGNNVGVDSVECFAVIAYNLKVTYSEVYFQGGNSNSSVGLRMNGGEAIIENSKALFCGGDLITLSTANLGGFTTGMETTHDVKIVNSEACFYGGKTADGKGKSVGIDLTSKKNEQHIDIVNSRFDTYGETKGIRVYDDDLCKVSCPELYGMNKETGNYEKFDVKNLEKYTDIATSNWIEDKEIEKPIPASVVIIGLLMALLVVIGIVMYRRDRS